MKKVFLLLIIINLLFLISCNEKYNINYDLDGGEFTSSVKTSFSNSKKMSLPTPIKDGYIFLGWEENNNYINALENKNYNLKALWAIDFDYTFIHDEDIFNMPENEYLVYCLKDGCIWCEKTKEDVLKYIAKCNLSYFNNNKPKVYVLNLNSNGKQSKLYKNYYLNEDLDDTNYCDNATSVDDIYLNQTPCMIKVKENNNVRYANYICSGKSNIVNYLNDIMVNYNNIIDVRKSYTITYNVDDLSFTESFYNINAYTLYNPVKEGYIFVGWTDEEDNKIDKIDYKDYVLKANFVKILNSIEIEKQKVFDYDASYYVLFITKREGVNIDNYLKIINLYNTYAAINNFDYIYVTYLDDYCDISRSYSTLDEDYNYITGVTKWDDLYIFQSAVLMKVIKKDDINTGIYIKSTLVKIKKYLENEYNIILK